MRACAGGASSLVGTEDARMCEAAWLTGRWGPDSVHTLLAKPHSHSGIPFPNLLEGALRAGGGRGPEPLKRMCGVKQGPSCRGRPRLSPVFPPCQSASSLLRCPYPLHLGTSRELVRGLWAEPTGPLPCLPCGPGGSRGPGPLFLGQGVPSSGSSPRHSWWRA